MKQAHLFSPEDFDTVDHALDMRSVLGSLPKSKRLQRIERNAPHAYRVEGDLERLLREIPEDDRPSARGCKLGVAALSTVELLQILTGGDSPESALRIMNTYRTPARILGTTVSELRRTGEITQSRALLMQAAFELSRRAALPEPELPRIASPKDAVEILASLMQGEQETMRVLSLNTKNRVVGNHLAYQGSVHTTVVRVSELFKTAVRLNAKAIIVAHSHPSGDPTPSVEDCAVTKEIKEAGDLLDIELLDHLVIGSGQQFVSFKERGLLQ